MAYESSKTNNEDSDRTEHLCKEGNYFDIFKSDPDAAQMCNVFFVLVY